MRTATSLLLLPLLLLTGCFDYAEDLWIHKDGSAELKLTYGYHEEIVEDRAELRAQLEEVARALEERDDVTHTEVEDWQDGEMQRASLLLGVRNYRDLEAIFDAACARNAKAIPADGGAGKTWEFTELEDGTLRVTRHFDTDGDGKAGSFPLTNKGLQPQNGEEENPFAGREVVFRFHAARVLDAEDEGQIDGDSVTWRFPLDQEDLVMPPQLRAQVALNSPFPWGLVLSGAFGLTAAVWLRKKWHRRWE